MTTDKIPITIMVALIVWIVSGAIIVLIISASLSILEMQQNNIITLLFSLFVVLIGVEFQQVAIIIWHQKTKDLFFISMGSIVYGYTLFEQGMNSMSNSRVSMLMIIGVFLIVAGILGLAGHEYKKHGVLTFGYGSINNKSIGS